MSNYVENYKALKELTAPQIRALASQRDIKEWKTVSIEKLIQRMARMKDIMEPVRA